jgi:predicted DNA binding CopG/RHH family protein
MNNYINNDEKQLMQSLDGIDVTQIKNDTKNIQQLKMSAKDFVQKQEAKMSIRISNTELDNIKKAAAKEGLKYQTFVKSVLHKYITKQLTP